MGGGGESQTKTANIYVPSQLLGASYTYMKWVLELEVDQSHHTKKWFKIRITIIGAEQFIVL